MNYFLTALAGVFGGVFFVLLLRGLSLRFKILVPQGIPLIGGIAVYLSFIIASLAGFYLFGGFPQEAKGIIIASFIMLVFGIIDDWKEFSVQAKFAVQIVAISLLIFFGVKTQIVNIGTAVNIAVTFIWVLGISNAFNHLDVSDGVAGGTALIVSLSFFAISFLNGDVNNGVLALALASAIAGFLAYNLPPAKIYMGNSGSHFLGFILAAAAMGISYAPEERKIALLSPILILGLPIFDTAFLIFMRVKQGRSMLKKSDDHLALRFIKSGHSKRKALLFMLLIASFFSFCGILISQVPSPFGIIIIIFAASVTLLLTRKMGGILV
ncbi:MAG: MraY family glycosyltransferase [Candidatus Omnitrophica bacterium]|nr:MraY family glycosyltransferase [Candidatus Omnitrophota bacterium]MDD5552722.1 MraY family glycosyltransferase [Candidatus Omnitrophota bacterium]